MAGDISIVERGREIAMIEAALERARDGAGSVVVIEGLAGIGKTRLVEVSAGAARRAGLGVLRAQGRELETGFAFGVVLQLLEERVKRMAGEDRAALLEGAAALAQPLLTGARAPRGGLDEMLHGLFWVVANLSEDQPLALFVDDAHWADRPSLRFVEYMTHRLEELPLAIVFATRPAEATPSGELLVQISSHPLAVRVRPGPLTLEGVERLMGEWGFPRADPAFAEACREASGGFPLYLRELLLVLADSAVEGTGADAPTVAEVGPQAVLSAIQVCLRPLPPSGAALVNAAAILGDGASLGEAAELAGVDRAEAARVAAALARSGVLSNSTRIGFSHPIMRAAVYNEMGALERAFAHGRAAALLAQAGAAPERVASHLLEAEPANERWALDALVTAAEQARAGGDSRTAARLWRRALEEPGDRQERARLLVKLGYDEAGAGELTATARLREALPDLATPEECARAALLLGRILVQSGRAHEADEVLEAALERDGFDARLRRELTAGRVQAALWDRSAGGLERAISYIPSVGRPETPLERTALANLAGAMTVRGERPELCADYAMRAWAGGAVLEEAGPDEPALLALTSALSNTDTLAPAERIYDQIIEEGRRRGMVMAVAAAAFGRGAIRLHRAELGGAAADAELAIEAQRFGWGLYLPGAYWVLTQVLIERAELDRAAELLAMPAGLKRQLDDSNLAFAIHGARGSLALARGELDAAVAAYTTARAISGAAGIGNPVFFAWRAGAVSALHRLGREDEARAVADELAGLTERWPTPRARAIMLQAEATLAADEDERARLLSDAVDVLDGSPCLLECARTLELLGASLQRLGSRDAAVERLRRVLDIADRAGAVALARRAHEALLVAGARPRRARSTGVEALTPSELRVAQMAATGRTNRQIAQELFVTPKAVKWHLGNTYRKLDISSRSELAAVLAPVV